MIYCPHCNLKIEKNYSFCPNCGFGLSNLRKEENHKIKGSESNLVICDVCGEENNSDLTICSSCGARLSKNLKVGSEDKVEKKHEAAKSGYQVKKTGAPKKEDKESKQKIREENKVNPVQIITLVISLVALGLVVLYISGVFDTSINQNTNIPQVSTNQPDLSDIQRINELEKSVVIDSTNLNNVLELAHRLNDSGFLERSIKYYEMYLRANPQNADAQVDLGVVFFELKEHNKAKELMRKGLKINPAHQIAHFNIGVVNHSQGFQDSAKIWWEKAYKLNPDSDIGIKAKELLNKQ